MAARRPLRWRLGERDPGVGVRRGELAAALASAAVAGQLLFAPVTLLSAATLVGVGRISRWRPHWLALPTLVSVIWLYAVRPAEALAAFAAGSRRMAGFLLASATHPRVFTHPGVVAAGAGRWLATDLPLALLAACGEALLVLWLGWWRPGARAQSGWLWRPGLVAAAHRRISTSAMAAGHTSTSDGCAVGVAADTGKLAGFSWAEAMHGVLLTGEDRDLLGLAIACAALRRRKTVVILECASQTGAARDDVGRVAVADRVLYLARLFGVPVTAADAEVLGTNVGAGTGHPAGAGIASVSGAIGRAIRRRETVLVGTRSANEEPIGMRTASSGPPGMQADDAAREAAADLLAVLTGLRDLGLRADCLTLINGVEFMDPARIGELLALGPLTGTTIVLSTASSAHAARLASATGVVAVGYPMGVDLWPTLAARLRGDGAASAVIGREIANDALLGAVDPIWRPTASAREFSGPHFAQRPGEVTVLVLPPGWLPGRKRGNSRAAVTDCRIVPITLDYQ